MILINDGPNHVCVGRCIVLRNQLKYNLLPIQRDAFRIEMGQRCSMFDIVFDRVPP